MNNFDFIGLGFKTNRSFDSDFSNIPNSSGVYLLINRTINYNDISYEILYIGSSKNLKLRLSKHEVYRILSEIYEDIIPYFIKEKNYIQKEKELIQLLRPRFNKQWL